MGEEPHVLSSDSPDSFHECLLMGVEFVNEDQGRIPPALVSICVTGASDLTFLGLRFPICKMGTRSGCSGAPVKSMCCARQTASLLWDCPRVCSWGAGWIPQRDTLLPGILRAGPPLSVDSGILLENLGISRDPVSLLFLRTHPTLGASVCFS